MSQQIEHLIFANQTAVKPIALLVPTRDMQEAELLKYYVEPLAALGIPQEDVIAFNVPVGNKPPSVTAAREYLQKLGPIMLSAGVNKVLCLNGAYFKALTKCSKLSDTLGYAKSTLWPEIQAFYTPNFKQIYYDPQVIGKISIALDALSQVHLGKARTLGKNFIHSHRVKAFKVSEIKAEFTRLLQFPELTCDIETFSLQVGKAGLATIAFSQDKHNGSSFPLEYGGKPEALELLKQFLLDYTNQGGKLIYHGSTFDIKHMIWTLFMKDSGDITGMLEGLDILFRNFEDTKILAYLATNSASGNHLSLKDLAYEFTGAYAIDTEDITEYPVTTVLDYNVQDTCATWYVYEKYREEVLATQEDVYQKIFKPSLKVITQMELCGLPLNLAKVIQADHILEDIRETALNGIYALPLIGEFTDYLRTLKAEIATSKLKQTVKTKEDFLHLKFNPNSNPQLALLLYQQLQLPVTYKTKSGNPSTGDKALKALQKHEENSKQPRADILALLTHLRSYNEVDILLNTFIPAFTTRHIDRDGWKYLLGNFNLGGTKSGRLSSSEPNLQNIPSTGSKHAKIIKEAFCAPPKKEDDPFGWLYVGADYPSLEDRISALQTKDPNKLKVYTDGYDGHCLRAYSYFNANMPDITEQLRRAKEAREEVAIINSIEHRYPKLRQNSKGPTFALTYMGTWKTLVKNFGIPKDEAQQIEKNYHELYKVSDDWVKGKIETANKTGYVDLAFGLRLRTPLLPQVVLTSYKHLPYDAYQEIKTAGNALGQSYGLLNSHTANMFMEQVWASPYREWILPCAHIHDAQYYMVRNHLGCLKWVNDTLIKCMEWADLPDIRHPTVGLGGTLEVFWPDWSNPIKLPNYASHQEILNTLAEGKEKYNVGSL